MKEIFVSRPNWIPEKFEKGLNSFYNLLKANGLNPRTIGQSDYPNKSPLDEVIGLLKKCEGTIVLGIPQIEITNGLIKGVKLDNSIQLGTEWNHIEAALSHSLDLPMLVVHHETVVRGIFDRGACNSFLHKVNMEESHWATSDGISGAILNWKSELIKPIIAVSKNSNNDIKPTLKWGAYKFGDEPGLFCPVCYEKEGLKIPASRVNTKFYQCPNCQAKLS
jgi:hypothetical protein